MTQVDYLMSRMSSLKARIAGIEDQLNIEMDHRFLLIDLCKQIFK